MLSALIVALNSMNIVGFACAAVPLLMVGWLGWKRPYVKGYNNFREVFNQLATALILGCYGYLRMMVDYTQPLTIIENLIPYVVIGLLVLTVVVNAACLVKFKLDKMREGKQ